MTETVSSEKAILLSALMYFDYDRLYSTSSGLRSIRFPVTSMSAMVPQEKEFLN